MFPSGRNQSSICVKYFDIFSELGGSPSLYMKNLCIHNNDTIKISWNTDFESFKPLRISYITYDGLMGPFVEIIYLRI